VEILLGGEIGLLVLSVWSDRAVEILQSQGSLPLIPDGLKMDERFFAWVQKSPQACALAFSESGTWFQWSYLTLAQRAEAIARALKGMGVQSGEAIGITDQRDPNSIAAILGILKTGAVYLPLDPKYPQERLRKLCETASVRLVLTAKFTDERFPVTTHRIADLVATEPSSTNDPTDGQADPGSQRGERPAYILFTSGSTGEPKGVVVPHRAVIRLVDRPNFLSLGASRSFLWLAPLGFDASVLEIWAPLLNGARCVLFPQEESPTTHRLGEVIRSQGVDCLWLTASLFNSIIDQDPVCLGGVADLLVGGEALSVPHVRKALEALPQTRLINGYGPTENTTFTACYPIPRPLSVDVARIPIGTPITGTSVCIVDEALRLVDPGTEGELLAMGQGLALEYLHRPDLTAEKFNTLDLPPWGKVRAYRTGDRVVQRPDGLLEFVGRLDDQVKIEGHRIEPGEIEAVLARINGVRGVRVLVKTGPLGQKRLAAYLVADSSAGDGGQIRSQLGEKLPAFLIPHFFFLLDQFPLTPNGKLDIAALPDPFAPEVYPDPVGGSDDWEKVMGAWKMVLGQAPPSVDTNLFDAGATSLDAIRLHELLERIVGKPLDPHFVFSQPTVRRQALALRPRTEDPTDGGNRGQQRRAALAQRKRGGS